MLVFETLLRATISSMLVTWNPFVRNKVDAVCRTISLFEMLDLLFVILLLYSTKICMSNPGCDWKWMLEHYGVRSFANNIAKSKNTPDWRVWRLCMVEPREMFQSLIELADEAYSTRTTLAVDWNAVLVADDPARGLNPWPHSCQCNRSLQIHPTNNVIYYWDTEPLTISINYLKSMKSLIANFNIKKPLTFNISWILKVSGFRSQ